MTTLNAEGGLAERRSALGAACVRSLRDDHLQLIVLPTEQCNFRCTYCYEDFTVGRMAPAVVEGVKRLVDRRLDGLRDLRISWFGGEPLLAIGVIEEISGHVAEMARRTATTYVGDMTTNAYLLDSAMVRRLAALGIRSFQISLDGPKHLHDLTRIRRDGRGSFDRLWENLLAIRNGNAPVQVLLRIHLTPENLHAMPEFLRRIRKDFLDDRRFSVHLKPVEHLGGENDATTAVLSTRERERILADLQSVLGVEDSTADRSPYVCYAARPNSLVIRANGTVGKCTVSLTDPANNVGRLTEDGTLEIDNDRLRPWLRGWQSGDWDTLGCPADGFTLGEPLLQIGLPPNRSAE
ncbi:MULTISPECIES: radical SAM protein [unclassified Kitasatospora]|uniref:radical SAM protein n=1 Tax=unclassified Kitasatospora TaxID=2633591 RepID=UPI000B0D9A1F|nr:radical SAM protein [Kitasatospora sp. MY 5-36]